MDIKELLKRRDKYPRVTCNDRWLVWDEQFAWTVYERLPYQKYTRTIIQIDDFDLAVSFLSGDKK